MKVLIDIFKNEIWKNYCFMNTLRIIRHTENRRAFQKIYVIIL
jgi:hypothetical protein